MPRLNRRLEGRVAIVTGGASGIGAATARRLIAEGASVVLGDLQAEALEHMEAELGEACRTRTTDVRSEPDVDALVAGAVEEYGRLDIMFSNAGVLGAVGPIARSVMVDVDLTLAVNLRGVFLGMKHAARVMIPQGSGVIISTSSPAGFQGGLGPHAYSAAKAAVIGLTQSVAAELRPHGIRVNAVAPGGTVTAMVADALVGDAAALDSVAEAMTRTALMGRPIHPEDIAAAVAFLASDDAAFVTGETLRVDAGMTTSSGPSQFAAERFEGRGAFLEAGRRSGTEGPEES